MLIKVRYRTTNKKYAQYDSNTIKNAFIKDVFVVDRKVYCAFLSTGGYFKKIEPTELFYGMDEKYPQNSFFYCVDSKGVRQAIDVVNYPINAIVTDDLKECKRLFKSLQQQKANIKKAMLKLKTHIIKQQINKILK